MIPVAYLADRFGRRKTIQFGAAVYMCVLIQFQYDFSALSHHTLLQVGWCVADRCEEYVSQHSSGGYYLIY